MWQDFPKVRREAMELKRITDAYITNWLMQYDPHEANMSRIRRKGGWFSSRSRTEGKFREERLVDTGKSGFGQWVPSDQDTAE
jgi:hypothetical protein